MKTLAVNATHYRLLQGPVYPIAPNTCHAVTVITAYHPASIPEIHPGFEDIPDLVDPAKIESTFEDLWGPASTVHVDFKTLRLPVDDPAIDAISRTGFWGFEAHRTWISANWEDYWTPHEGCEPYVTFAVQTDAGSAPSFIPGLAMYDDDVGHRIALVLLSTHLRLFSDPASPISGADPTTEGYPLLMDLYVHETGHVFGLRHPHQIRTPNGYGENTTFETVYSGVSYGADGRVNEFGAIEETNTRRNQAGAVVVEAIDQYLRGTDAFDAAMEAMAENDWQEVIEILEPHLVHDPATSSSLDPYLPRLPRLPGPAG